MATKTQPKEEKVYGVLTLLEGENPKLDIATLRWHEEGARLAWETEKKQSWNRKRAFHSVRPFFLRMG